jgi:hypothetical protein
MRKNESGATVVVVISVIATLAIFTGAALDYTFTVGRNVERSDKMLEESAIASGCIQEQYMYWREICRASASQGPTTSAFSSIPLPTTTQFPNVPNFTATTGTSTSYTVSNYGVTAMTPELQPLSGSTATVPGVGTSGSNKTFFYRATATVSMPDRGANVTFKAAQIFEQQYQNPWDWALFFVDPLEIEPGPPFTITGWVQTNSSLYTPLSTLTFADKVTYGNQWFINTMPGDNHLIADGDTYAPPNWPTGLPPAQGTPGEPFGVNPSDVFNTSDPNDNNNGYHELIEVPDPHYPDPLSQQRYFDEAGAKIIVNESGSTITATVYDNSQPASVSGGTTGSGGVITGGNTVLGKTIGTVTYNTSTHAQVATSGTSNSAGETTLFNAMSGALTLGQSIQDNRQGATIGLTELNVGTLATDVNSNGLTFNQVVYIADQGATSSNQRAVELINGTVLPNNGLTVASQNPVYIQGDYNTGSNPPSNSGNTLEPTASGYTRQPSSIVGDAVDILSNSWMNSESTQTLSDRTASSTTVNAAIMAGNVPTANGNYSGGAENFPRFLEDWSNATLTYYGSMVELYASQQATGLWGQGNVYNPPTRAWYYDNFFQIHPPPGSIMVVNYVKGQWYQQ